MGFDHPARRSGSLLTRRRAWVSSRIARAIPLSTQAHATVPKESVMQSASAGRLRYHSMESILSREHRILPEKESGDEASTVASHCFFCKPTVKRHRTF